MNKRIISIDLLAAMMMVLVVIGHHTFAAAPAWYTHLHDYIYSFHMAVFVCVSSFLIAYAGQKETDDCNVWMRSVRKSGRFLWLLCTVGLVAIALKLAMEGNQIANMAAWMENVSLLLLYPMEGPAQFLWYMYFLVWGYLLYPMVRKLPNVPLLLLCLLSMFGGAVPVYRFLGVDLLCRYGCFYLLGIIAFRYLDRIRRISLQCWLLAGMPFVIYSIVYGLLRVNSSLPFVLTGLMALPFFAVCAMLMSKAQFARNLALPLSRYLLPLYLFQMFVIQGMRLVSGRLLPLTEYYALYVFISSVTTILGIIVGCKIYKRVTITICRRV